MRSIEVAGGDQATAAQYNVLRNDAYGGSQLHAHEQASPDLTLKIEPGIVFFGRTRVSYAGGNSPSISAPASNPRIDLLTIDIGGTIAVTTGTEAGSPTPPSHPTNYSTVIAEVYCRVGMTTIRDVDTMGAGYIYRDTRPYLLVDPRRYQRTTLPFETSARYAPVTSGAGAAVTFGDGTSNGLVTFNSGTTTSGYASIRAAMGGASGFTTFFDQEPELHAFAQVPTIVAAQTKSAFIVCGNLASTFATLTTAHFGFEIRDTNGTGAIYATWADGGTRGTQSVLTGGTVTDPHHFFARIVGSSRIEFFIDNALVHTATTNIPSGALDAANIILQAGVLASTGTTTYDLYLGPAEIVWRTF